MAQAVLERCGGRHHPKPAVFEKPGANLEVEGERREGGSGRADMLIPPQQ